MGRKSRSKGKRGEREWARLMAASGFDAWRTGYMQSKGSEDAPDVTHTFAIAEVKLRKGLSITDVYNGVQQVASAEGHDGKLRYFAGRKDRQPWLVAMDAPNFLRIYFSYFVDRLAHAKPSEAVEAMVRAKAGVITYGGTTEFVLPLTPPLRKITLILQKAYASPRYAECRMIVKSGDLSASRVVDCELVRKACKRAQEIREAVHAR